MVRFQKIFLLCFLLISSLGLVLKAQSPQIDFKYDKIVKETGKIEIQINITDGDGPYKYIVYQGDPLDKGISLIEEETSQKVFSIQIENKSDLFLYVASLSLGKPKSFKIVQIK
jgi:hypothetical protein